MDSLAPEGCRESLALSAPRRGSPPLKQVTFAAQLPLLRELRLNPPKNPTKSCSIDVTSDVTSLFQPLTRGGDV